VISYRNLEGLGCLQYINKQALQITMTPEGHWGRGRPRNTWKKDEQRNVDRQQDTSTAGGRWRRQHKTELDGDKWSVDYVPPGAKSSAVAGKLFQILTILSSLLTYLWYYDCWVCYSCRLRGPKFVHSGNGLPLLALRHLLSLPVSTPLRITV